MGGMRLSDLDFVRLLPVFMQDDAAVVAFSEAMNKLIGEPSQRFATLRTWDKIDELNDAECDEMAWELDIDWYDSAGMTLEEKQEAIKLAQQIKRKRGTKWAVERLIASYFGEGYVAEWYEVNGVPYTFVVLTTNPQVTPENFDKFVEMANIAKNERSHIAGIFYYWQQGPETGVEFAPASALHRYDFRKCGTHYRPAVVGFIVKSAGIETEPETEPHLYDFRKCGINGYKATVGVDVVGRAVVGKSICYKA